MEAAKYEDEGVSAENLRIEAGLNMKKINTSSAVKIIDTAIGNLAQAGEFRIVSVFMRFNQSFRLQNTRNK